VPQDFISYVKEFNLDQAAGIKRIRAEVNLNSKVRDSTKVTTKELTSRATNLVKILA
jgi:hypothetical protein